MIEEDSPAETPTAKESEVVDDLMDSVATLLKSQMRTANQHLRKRAARLLSPSRVAPSVGEDSTVS